MHLTLACYLHITSVNIQQNWFLKDPFGEMLDQRLTKVPSTLIIYAPMIHRSCETAGSPASLSWVGKRIGSSVGGFRPRFVSNSIPVSTREKWVTCQLWGGVFLVPSV